MNFTPEPSEDVQKTKKYQCKLPETSITCRSTSVLKGGIRRIENLGFHIIVKSRKQVRNRRLPGSGRPSHRQSECIAHILIGLLRQQEHSVSKRNIDLENNYPEEYGRVGELD